MSLIVLFSRTRPSPPLSPYTTLFRALTITGTTNSVYLGRRLDLPAGQMAIWTGSYIGFQDAGTLHNLRTFRVAHTADRSFFNHGGTGTNAFHNVGAFIKTAAGTGATD